MIEHFRFNASLYYPTYDFGFKDGKLYSLHILKPDGNYQYQYRTPSNFEHPIQLQSFKEAIDTACKDRTSRHFAEFIECLNKDSEYFNIAKDRILEEICYMSDKLNIFCKAYNVCVHKNNSKESSD